MAFSLALLVVLLVLFFPREKEYKAKVIRQRGSENTWHKKFDVFGRVFGKKYLQARRKIIEEEIKNANVQTTPENIVIEQFAFSIIFASFLILIYLITYNKFYLVMGIIGGIAFFFEPRLKLKRKTKQRKENVRKQIPDYALTVQLLLKGKKTPVDALKLACEYCPGTELRYYTDILYIDLDHMDTKDALQKFATLVDIPEAAEFATNMSQFLSIGANEDGMNILRQMEFNFRELQKRSLEKEKINRPKKLQVVNFIIYIDVFLFIITLLAMYGVQLITGGVQ